jgi:hypothetical protein
MLGSRYQVLNFMHELTNLFMDRFIKKRTRYRMRILNYFKYNVLNLIIKIFF